MNINIPNAADVTQSTHPEPKTTARFMNRAGVSLIKVAMKITSAISVRAGARLGYRVLSQPPRFKAPEKERLLYSSAKHSNISFRNGHLKVLEWGTGPTVLLVHCWGGRATHFCDLIETLTVQGFHVVSFDGPAHGESYGKRTDMFEFSEAVAEVAKTIGPIEAVIAHSFGAAMTLLARRDLGLKAECFVLISGFKSCNWFLDAFGLFFDVSPKMIEQMKRDFDQRRGKPVNWAALSMIDVMQELAEPVLLIHDQSDAEIPFTHARQIQAASNGAKLVATEGLGHRRILKDGTVIRETVDFIRASAIGASK
jgi:pimeloyl-ACP methyl ester carboxylesterase